MLEIKVENSLRKSELSVVVFNKQPDMIWILIFVRSASKTKVMS